ncbi:hypothetical protein GVAV_002706 [Gurleya vavrai]
MHRKNIFEIASNDCFGLKKEDVKKIMKECEVCARNDKPVLKKSYNYKKVENPESLVGFELFKIKKVEKKAVFIDYFSGKAFFRDIETKSSNKNLHLI